MTFAAQLAAERPDEVALRDDECALSWRDGDERLRPAVNALIAADLGARRRVAVRAGNSAQPLLGSVACTLAGSSAVAVTSHLTAAETAYILEDSGARAVLCDRRPAPVAAAAARLAGIPTA